MSAPLLDYALRAHAAGLCVLPPREDGSKRPIGDEWERYQQERSSEEELRGWYGLRTGIGYVCGKISDNLEMLEAEDVTTFADLKRAAATVGLSELLERIEAGYAQLVRRLLAA